MIGKLLELVFPENIYCICCGSIIDKTRSYSLCDTCMKQFHWITGRACAKCGKALQEICSDDICYDCMENDHIFDEAVSCVSYGLNERAVMLDMKYRDKPYIARKLGEVMADKMATSDIVFDMVTSVPVHPSRLKERGYNQAFLCAKEFARITSVEYTECVRRITETAPMRGLSWDDRRENISGAFKVTEDVKDRDILVIDDIYTTGATLDEIASVLKEAGAAHVYGLSFASAMNRIPYE